MTIEFPTNSPFAALIPQYEALVAQVKEADAKLAGLAGTHAARKADALAKLTAADVAARESASDAHDTIPVGPVEALVWAQQVYDAAKTALDDAKNAVDEAVNAALRADKSANTTERDSILAARESLVTSAAAMATLIAGSPKPLTANDLGLGKPKGTGSASPRSSAKTGKGVFSYRRDGVAEFTTPCDAQQSLSSIAYRVFEKATVGDLRAAMAIANGDSPVDETKDFEVMTTLNGKTATLKFSVIAEATPES